MSIFASIVLLLIFIVQLVHLYEHFLGVSRENRVITSNQRIYLKQIERLEKENQEIRDALHNLVGRKISSTGFIMCADGVKMLPDDWKQRFYDDAKPR